jgi:antitoxin CptB
MDTATINRLRWRCRRGTRELDQVLAWYLEQAYPVADAPTQQAFAELLDAQDPDLWNWVLGKESPSDIRFGPIIDAIRSRHRL